MSISVEPLVLSLSGFISTVHYDIVSQMKFKGKQSYKIWNKNLKIITIETTKFFYFLLIFLSSLDPPNFCIIYIIKVLNLLRTPKDMSNLRTQVATRATTTQTSKKSPLTTVVFCFTLYRSAFILTNLIPAAASRRFLFQLYWFYVQSPPRLKILHPSLTRLPL